MWWVVILLSLMIGAQELQARWKIPGPVTLMVSVMALSLSGLGSFHLDAKEFDLLIVIVLPLLLADDALKLEWRELKEHAWSITSLALFGLVIFAGWGIALTPETWGGVHLSWPELLMLFAMIGATDPITVSSVFSCFNVPEKLKTLTYGESLFNDATALILFSMGLMFLQMPKGPLHWDQGLWMVAKSIWMVAGSLGVAWLMTKAVLMCLKTSQDPWIETWIVLWGGYAAYAMAESVHASAVLSVVLVMIGVRKSMTQAIASSWTRIEDVRVNKSQVHQTLNAYENQKKIGDNVELLSFLGSTVVFLAMAQSMQWSIMVQYWKEIVGIFVLSTLCRGLTLLKMVYVSKKVDWMHHIQWHWWAVLTAAGAKGAFSLLMVHMLPEGFQHKALFEAIVIGNVLLSTVVYSLLLALIFYRYASLFEQDIQHEDYDSY